MPGRLLYAGREAGGHLAYGGIKAVEMLPDRERKTCKTFDPQELLSRIAAPANRGSGTGLLFVPARVYRCSAANVRMASLSQVG